ncbi:MAG TPA: hypothetical protein VHL57_07510 [Flavobacteriales bacterium]|nr:hypothetical protein [Flavobacteriales bacterium]
MALLVLSAPAIGGSIYTWSSGENLSASTLNATFQHIHNNMVGGHGARLVDADVSASANISRSKLAAYPALPLAWAKVGSGTTACSSGTCTLGDSYGVTSVTASSSVYTVTLTTSLGDTEYGVLVSSHTNDRHCTGFPATATTVTVNCRTIASSPAAGDAVFTVSVFDNN